MVKKSNYDIAVIIMGKAKVYFYKNTEDYKSGFNKFFKLISEEVVV